MKGEAAGVEPDIVGDGSPFASGPWARVSRGDPPAPADPLADPIILADPLPQAALKPWTTPPHARACLGFLAPRKAAAIWAVYRTDEKHPARGTVDRWLQCRNAVAAAAREPGKADYTAMQLAGVRQAMRAAEAEAWGDLHDAGFNRAPCGHYVADGLPGGCAECG